MALKCPNECQNCDIAGLCQACNFPDYYFNGSLCVLCDHIHPKCTKCANNSVCTECLVGYNLFNSTSCQIYCSNPNCSICLEDDIETCVLCAIVGYLPKNGICTKACGNSIIQTP